MLQSTATQVRLGRRAIGLLATGAAVLAFASPPPADAAPSPKASTALVSGQVLDGDAVSGASVTLTAWPSTDTLNTLADGVTVPTRTISITSTDANGNYAASPNLADIPAIYREPDGTVNLQVEASTGTTDQIFNLPSATPGSASAALMALGVPGARPAIVTFDLGPQLVTETIAGHTTSAKVATSHSPSSAPGTKKPAGTPYPGGCRSWVAGSYIRNQPERFMNVWAISVGHAEVEQTVSSSHTLGIGLSVSGSAWRADGHAAITTHVSGGAAVTYSAPRTIYNAVQYRRYARTCFEPSRSVTENEVRPAGFNDLFSKTISISPNTYPYCVVKSTGRFFKNHGSNYDYSAGVSLGFVSLESQAQYSNDTTIRWT
jgi:hypothetical protein